jgi:hypothetical protein
MMQETTTPVSTELLPSTIRAIIVVELEGGNEMEVEEEVEERRRWRS